MIFFSYSFLFSNPWNYKNRNSTYKLQTLQERKAAEFSLSCSFWKCLKQVIVCVCLCAYARVCVHTSEWGCMCLCVLSERVCTYVFFTCTYACKSSSRFLHRNNTQTTVRTRVKKFTNFKMTIFLRKGTRNKIIFFLSSLCPFYHQS